MSLTSTNNLLLFYLYIYLNGLRVNIDDCCIVGAGYSVVIYIELLVHEDMGCVCNSSDPIMSPTCTHGVTAAATVVESIGAAPTLADTDCCFSKQGFFRRSIQQKIQYRPCTKNQQCSILRINRNRCQYCRLKKCIAVGMSRDGECLFVYFCVLSESE